MILYIIIGVVLWQLLTTICFLACGDRSDRAIPFACGVWTLPVVLISKIWKRAVIAYYRATCNVYELYAGNDKVYSRMGQAIIHNNIARKLRQNSSSGYHIRMISDYKNINEKPAAAYYISKRHLPPIYREFVQLARIHK